MYSDTPLSEDLLLDGIITSEATGNYYEFSVLTGLIDESLVDQQAFYSVVT